MFDLIVVGAGPAGSSAARLAGRLGLDTLLIDKQLFPRYKACGGGVTERALSHLDFDLPPELCEATIFAARVHYGGSSIEARMERPIAHMVSRSTFDAYLLERARETGISLSLGERVLELEEKDEVVEVCTDQGIYESAFVVVAEGAQGTLKHRVRRRDEKDEYGICLVTEIPLSEVTTGAFSQDAIDIHFGIGGMGYGWVFPHGEYYSVGIGGLASSMRRPRETMAECLRARGLEGGHRQRGHVIPVGGIRRTLGSARVLLAGDAAGFMDSFTGEGIAYAIRSGQMAGDVMWRALSGGGGSRLAGEYQSLCEEEFGSNLRYSLFLAGLMHRFPVVFFRLLAGNQDVVDKFTQVATGRWSYQRYLIWSISRLPKHLLRR